VRHRAEESVRRSLEVHCVCSVIDSESHAPYRNVCSVIYALNPFGVSPDSEVLS
jgi:hypothetical protein